MNVVGPGLAGLVSNELFVGAGRNARRMEDTGAPEGGFRHRLRVAVEGGIRACHDDGIGFTCESEIGGMHRVVAAVDKPSREPGRKRHVDEEPHLAGEGCNSTVSSSARKAA